MPPPFSPPKPKIGTGLLTLFDVMDTSLHTANFTVSMRKCFVEVGLLPQADGTYVKFNYHKKGFLTKLIPQATEAHADMGPTFGDVATELELTNRPASDAASDAGSDSTDSSDFSDAW